MSAEVLRMAAESMRNDHGGRRVTSDSRWLPVADWLDAQAERAEIGFGGKCYTQALAVARAYLGEAS